MVVSLCVSSINAIASPRPLWLRPLQTYSASLATPSWRCNTAVVRRLGRGGRLLLNQTQRVDPLLFGETDSTQVNASGITGSVDNLANGAIN